MDYIFKRAFSLKEIKQNKNSNIVWLYFDHSFFNVVVKDIEYYGDDRSIHYRTFDSTSTFKVSKQSKQPNFTFFHNFIKQLKNFNKFKSDYSNFPYDSLYNAMCSFFIENRIESYTTYHQSTLINVL